MNKFILSAIAAATLFTTGAVAQVNMPQPSPTQTIKQDFGMGKIELTYSRPSVKGRKMLGENSELVPLGKPWRTGANAATKISFTDNVSIGGISLDTGSYVIYTIPNKDEWDIVFSKGKTFPGNDDFKQSDDVARVKAAPMKMKDNVETFTMQFANVKPESCELHLMWGNTAVAVPIATNIKDKLRAQVEAGLKGEKKPYQQAATFYYEWDKDYAKALDNVNKGIESNPKAFWLLLLKAKIQRDMGDKEGAKMSAGKTIEVATEAKNEDYVRMAKELVQKM